MTHHVEATELAAGEPHERLRDVALADRGDLRHGAPAGVGDCLHRFAGGVLVEVVDDHRGAGRGERDRVGAAETAAAAGHDGDAAVQVELPAHA